MRRRMRRMRMMRRMMMMMMIHPLVTAEGRPYRVFCSRVTADR